MVSAKRLIPEQLQRYQKLKKIEDQLKEAESSLEDKKKEFNTLLTSMQSKTVRKMQLTEEIANVSAKNSIYQMKIHDIDQQIVDEKEIAAKIEKAMPVKFDLENGKVENAEKALVVATAELQKFYADYDQNNRYEGWSLNSTIREQMWTNLNTNLSKIPNIVLWNCLSKQMEQKVLSVEALVKHSQFKALPTDPKEDCDDLNLGMTKLYAKHMILFIRKNAIKQESERATNDYVVYYNSFVEQMRAKFAMYNNENIEDDVLAEYMTSFSSLHYAEGEMDYLKRAIAENDSEIQRRRKVNDEYKTANDALRQIYSEIESSYVRVQDDLTALKHVKEKIIHSKNCIQYLLQSKTDQQNSMLATTMRMNKSSGSSFNTSNNSIFHSAPSESFDNTKSDNTIVRPMPVVTMPTYSNEIKLFAEASIEFFKPSKPLECEMTLGMNPLIKSKFYDSLPEKVKIIIPDPLLTPYKSLRQIAFDVEWFTNLKNSMKHTPFNVALPIVNESSLVARKRKQKEEITEIYDTARAVSANVDHTVDAIREYIDLFQNNPLAKLVPNTVLVEGKTYKDYEREFMMYYNMINKD